MVRPNGNKMGQRKGASGMREEMDIGALSEEELIRRFSVEINGTRYVRASVLDAIGRRNAERANRRPGDPGTPENPVFRNGWARPLSSPTATA